MRKGAERPADVAHERTDIRAPGTTERAERLAFVRMKGFTRKRMYGNGSRGQGKVLAPSRKIVRPLSLDFKGRETRRDLHLFSHEPGQDRFDFVFAGYGSARTGDSAFGVERVGFAAETDSEGVDLRLRRQELKQTRGVSQGDDEKARGRRVERARVPDFTAPAK